MRTSEVSLLLGLLVLGTVAIASAQDVRTVLANYPDYSAFLNSIESTGVFNEINSRSSLTILLPYNGALNGYLSAHPSYTTQEIADVLRYHCLLQYFDCQSLEALTIVEVVTTLYQTTGRANDADGFVNITNNAGTVTFSPSTPGSAPEATLISNVTQYPYNYSFCSISGVMFPLGLAAAQLAPVAPPTVAPTPAPLIAPVAAPTMAPTLTPTTAPTIAPTMAPSVTPTLTPVTAPVKAPIIAPTTAPAKTPVTAPLVANGPVAERPTTSVSSAFALKFNFFAVVASVFVAAFLF